MHMMYFFHMFHIRRAETINAKINIQTNRVIAKARDLGKDYTLMKVFMGIQINMNIFHIPQFM